MKETDAFISAMRAWMKIFMHRSMRNFIHFAKAKGLSLSQCGALIHLYHLNCTGVSDLGDQLGVSSAAASQLLDRLVQQDLILRSEDPDDRRVKQIALTEKGCQVVDEGIRARIDWLSDLAEIVSASEKKQIASALNVLIEKANLLGCPKDCKCNNPGSRSEPIC